MARIKQGVYSWEDVLAQRYQSNQPRPLTHPCRRTSTISQPQPQCRLLSRLSPELRLLIWEHVLGGQRLHIIQRSGQRLGYVVCPLSTTSDKKHDCEICVGTGIPQPVKDGDLCHSRTKNILGLSITCRQIYHESIHLLYTLNTLEFSNPWSLPYLHPTIPPHHWDSIRAVELRWSFPGHWLPSKDPVRAVYLSAGRTQWLETCRALTRLPSLQSFVLILGSSWFSEPIEKLAVFLEPLRGLRFDRPRGLSGFDRLVMRQLNLAEESSSDEESGIGFSASSNANLERKLGLPTTSRAWSCPLLSITDPLTDLTDPSPALKRNHGQTTWELRLQGQSYYMHELGQIGRDLRRRGIDCCISIA